MPTQQTGKYFEHKRRVSNIPGEVGGLGEVKKCRRVMQNENRSSSFTRLLSLSLGDQTLSDTSGATLKGIHEKFFFIERCFANFSSTLEKREKLLLFSV